MPSALPARRLILLTGSRESTTAQLRGLIERSGIEASRVAWPSSAVTSSNMLGQDFALAVFDVWQGLDPDRFGRLSGLVQAGGALVILCPDPRDWRGAPDPLESRFIPYSLPPGSAHRYYLRRWLGILSTTEGIETCSPDCVETLPEVRPIQPSSTPGEACTPDQQEAIDAVLKAARGQRRRPAIISADRGRGKSAALGLAAGRLIGSGEAKKILVTASGFAQTRNLFRHAMDALPNAEWSAQGNQLSLGQSQLAYVASDRLLDEDQTCDLLLVDEAASLGVAKLQQILQRYPRLALASTEHGYEGSGRGFALKFRELVRQYCRGHYPVSLHTPVRWSPNDPLERWTNELLLLQLQAPDSTRIKAIPPDSLSFRHLPQSALAKDERLLRTVFGLLVNAHYQTRPVDARYLLDAPNSSIHVAEQGDTLLGLVWIMHEGGLDSSTAIEVVAGRRRPQGHPVPQALAAHLGLEVAATLRCQRVQRIAVLPEAQGLGIGTWMLQQLEHPGNGQPDYLATSFGADSRLLRFWRRAGYQPVRVSERRRASSGLHSALLIKPGSPHGEQLLAAAQAVHGEQFPVQLGFSLHRLDPALVLGLSTGLPSPPGLVPQQLQAAALFAWGSRPFSSSVGALRLVAIMALAEKTGEVGEAERGLLAARLLQGRSWSECAELFALDGQADCIRRMRQATAQLLERYCPRAALETLRKKYRLR